MALAALIAAYQQVDEGGGDALCCTLPLVGRTVVEHQARQAERAGARHILILVERLPAALTAAIDRLRRDGLPVEIARNISDAADRVHPDEKVLLVADGCIAPQGAIERLVAEPSPALLTLADEPGREDYERIDGGTRWAGLALIDGARLRETSAMLGDWDAQSVLLRRTVQEGAARVDAFADADAPSGPPIVVAGAQDARALERRLLGDAGKRGSDWTTRWLFEPMARHALRLLADRISEPFWLALSAAVVAFVAAGATQWWSPWAGLILLMVSGPLLTIADRLSEIRLAPIRYRRPVELLRAVGASLALAALASWLGDWGWWAVAALLAGTMAALATERRMADRADGQDGSPWLASIDGVVWGFVPFAVAGRWSTGMIAMTAYAALSFGLTQARLRNALANKAVGHGE